MFKYWLLFWNVVFISVKLNLVLTLLAFSLFIIIFIFISFLIDRVRLLSGALCGFALRLWSPDLSSLRVDCVNAPASACPTTWPGVKLNPAKSFPLPSTDEEEEDKTIPRKLKSISWSSRWMVGKVHILPKNQIAAVLINAIKNW